MENEQELEQEQVNPEVEESTKDVDKDAEIAKYKAIAERKTKQLEKVKEAGEEPQAEVVNKPKEEQVALTREEAIFFSKGGNDDDLTVAKKIAELEGISILAAMEDDFYKSKVAAREAAIKTKANTLGASSGSASTGHAEKPVGKMTREEHEAHFQKRIAG